MSNFIVNSQLLRWDNVLEGTGIVFDRLGGLGKNVSISVDTNVIATVSSLEAYQQVSGKDAAGGYAGLDASGKIDTSQINFDTSTFYRDANGIFKLKTDRISNPFTATGLGSDGVPTGLALGEDAATLAEVEVNDTIRFSTAIAWNGTDYEAQTVFMRVATVAGTLADFAVQGAPVTSLDQLEQGSVNKYLTPEQLEKLIRMNYSDIAYTGQLSSTADDCDGYLTSGVWNVPNASAILNTPVNGQGGILFCFQRGSYSNSARVQVYLQSAGAANPVIPYIRVYNGTAATWSAWERIIKSTDLATTAANGLMSAADKAKIDGLGTQTQLDGKYVKKTGDTMTGNLVFPTGKGVNGSLLGVYPSTVSATNLDGLLKANTTFSYTFYYFPNTFALTPALIAKNVVLADNSNTMQTWNSGSGEGYQRAIIYPSSSNPLLKFYGDVWKEYIFREDLASSAKAGVMSAADKTKLDALKTQTEFDDKYVVNAVGNANGRVRIEGKGTVTGDNYESIINISTAKTYLQIDKNSGGDERIVLESSGSFNGRCGNWYFNLPASGGGNHIFLITTDGMYYTPKGGTRTRFQTQADVDVFMRGNIYLATATVNGLMSVADKTKLDALRPDALEAAFDFSLAPTQGNLILVLKNAPLSPWNVHAEIVVQQYSGSMFDRTEPAKFFAEGHFAQGEYDLLVTGFPVAAVNGTYKDSGGRVWTHSTTPQYTIQYVSGRWRIMDGTSIVYSTHSDDGNPYGTIGSSAGSWVWCNGDTMEFLSTPKVVADTSTTGTAKWKSLNYNASSITNTMQVGFCKLSGVTYPALILNGKFTQGKVVVKRIDYNGSATDAGLALVATKMGIGVDNAASIQENIAKRFDPMPGNVEWENLTAQVVQSTNRADGVRRSYCAALTLGALSYSGALGWSASSCTIEAPTVSLDLQNTPTDFAVDVAVEAAAAGKNFSLALTNGIQGTHCVVSFRNVSTYRIGMTDGNGKIVYLAGGETALARLVSVNAANRFEWIASGTGNGSGGGVEYVSFTAADVDANGNLVIIAAGEPVAICKTDLSNRIEYGITAQENAGSGLLKSTINIAGVPLGSGTWYAICK